MLEAYLYGTVLIILLSSVALIDLKTLRIPNSLSLTLFILGIAMSLMDLGFCNGRNSILGAVFGFTLAYLINALYFRFTHQNGLGMGDIKLLGALGAIFGWQLIVPLLFIASLSCLIKLILCNKVQRLSDQSLYAFGPFLSLSAIGCIFYQLSSTS
jgi:leader peptidase (prepilin peptidase)/N-methyltransferase